MTQHQDVLSKGTKMNSITASTLTRKILENPALSALLALSVWIAALMSGSDLAILAASLLIIARPFIYIALITAKEGTEKPGVLSSLRAGLANSAYRGTWADGHNSTEFARGRALV